MGYQKSIMQSVVLHCGVCCAAVQALTVVQGTIPYHTIPLWSLPLHLKHCFCLIFCLSLWIWSKKKVGRGRYKYNRKVPVEDICHFPQTKLFRAGVRFVQLARFETRLQ
jgi:hypothetical protein